MSTNIDKHKRDLVSLIAEGNRLSIAMQCAFAPDVIQRSLKRSLKSDKKVKEFIEKVPSFTSNYQTWYTEALVLLKQLLPDRLSDFTSLYEKPKANRKSLTSENYVIEDALQGLQVTHQFSNEKIVAPDAAIPRFMQQLSILSSVKKRFISSLFDIKQLVQADVFDSELDSARELNKKGFVRGAGAMAGVVLEGHLIQVCNNHNIKVRKKKPTINDLNQLLKDNDVIDTPAWRKLQHHADLRNLCDHKSKTEPKKEDINELITGVAKTIKMLS